MRLSESDGEYCSVVLFMGIISSPWQHIADELSRQPNVDNISPIDKKPPSSIPRPGTILYLAREYLAREYIAREYLSREHLAREYRVTIIPAVIVTTCSLKQMYIP